MGLCRSVCQYQYNMPRCSISVWMINIWLTGYAVRQQSFSSNWGRNENTAGIFSCSIFAWKFCCCVVNFHDLTILCEIFFIQFISCLRLVFALRRHCTVHLPLRLLVLISRIQFFLVLFHVHLVFLNHYLSAHYRFLFLRCFRLFDFFHRF